MRLAPIMQAFFTDYLMTQRHASRHTIASYRDCLRTSKASPSGHAAWHLFWARTPISCTPPRGCTTSATRPAWP